MGNEDLISTLLYCAALAVQVGWAAGLLKRSLVKQLPALTIYLLFSGLFGLALSGVGSMGFFGLVENPRRLYTLSYVAVQVVSMALAGCALFELATRSLQGWPRFQELGGKLVRVGLTLSGFLAVALVFAPQEWVLGWRAFHNAQYLTLATILGVTWVIFRLACGYARLELAREPVLFGWIFASIYGTAPLFAALEAPLTAQLFAIAAYSVGAALAWTLAPSTLSAPPASGSGSGSEDAAVRAALARLDQFDETVDALRE